MTSRRTASKITSVDDARHYAERRLPRFLYQRYEAGSGRAVTLRANVQAFDEVQFRPRVASYAPSRDLGTTVLGLPIALPVMLGPVGYLRLGHPDGESGVARAADSAKTITVVSTATGTAIEDVCAATESPVFFQLYYLGSREAATTMIERASRAGCQALVVTVDGQAPYSRERPVSDRASAPASLRPRELLRVFPQVARRPGWLYGFVRDGCPLGLPMGSSKSDEPLSMFDMHASLYAQTPTWEDIGWMRTQWDGPIVVKGITTADDARRAVHAGVDALVVSNHGGNGLDGRPASIRALPEVVHATNGDAEIWLDSGIRRGSDVVKALALGARAVLLGRAYVYALMAAGEHGVRRVLELFAEEIDHTLAFLGCSSVTDLNADYVETPSVWPRLLPEDSRPPQA